MEKAEKEVKAMAKLTKEELIQAIENLTVTELAELVKALEEKFGVSAAVPVAVGAPVAAQAAGGEQKAEEKTEFTVILATVPPEKKIQIIKEVRAVTNLGLKEAKELVEGAPKPIKEGVTKEDAEKIKKQLTAAGATVEIK
jgi:large subunit ribosomal protein L7/L12